MKNDTQLDLSITYFQNVSKLFQLVIEDYIIFCLEFDVTSPLTGVCVCGCVLNVYRNSFMGL